MSPGPDWLDQARRLLDAFVEDQSAAPGAAEGSATSTQRRSDCSWCPLCQAAAVARGERPEVTAALADVLSATATALRTFAESGESAERAESAEAARPAEPGPPAHADDGTEPPPPVQRIEIA